MEHEKLVDVIPPTRTAPKQQTAPKNADPKVTNQRKKQSAATKAGDIAENEVTQFTLGIFGILATVAGDHWALDEDEAETLTKPLTQILNKMNKKKKDNINTAIAPMLLVAAAGTIIVPRLLITISDMKARKKYERRSNVDERKVDRPSGVPSTSDSRPIQQYVETSPDKIRDANEVAPTVPPFIANLFNNEY